MTSRRPPNILWIQTDEQRTDSLGCYGAADRRRGLATAARGPLLPPVCTPNFDALAARGTLFLDHHTQSPVCVPSRVCELTSRYPHQTGILNNAVHYTWGRWPEGVVSFPELLADAGYVTVNMGKYHTPHHPTWLENWHFEWFPGEATFFGLADRFDEADHEVIHIGHRVPEQRGVILSGRYPYIPSSECGRPVRQPVGQAAKCGRDVRAPAATGRTPQTYLVDHALDWLRMYDHVRRPFLLRVSFLAPHTPVLAPEPFYSIYDPAAMDWDVPAEAVLRSRPDYEVPPAVKATGSATYRAHTDAEYRRMRATYYGLVSHVDQQVGRLLDGLEETGVADNTVVVVTSDHGDLMGEYGQFQKGVFYDITTRVPCILAGPGVAVGERVTRLTEGIDLAPTLLNLAGVPVPDTFEGRDLLTGAPREEVVGEICLPRGGRLIRRSWIRTARWSLDVTSEIDGEPVTDAAARDGKLIDVRHDPLAHENLYGDPAYASVVADLLARFQARTARDRVPVQLGGPPV